MLKPNSFTVSALALAFVQGSHCQNSSTPGPAWVQSEYDTSPAVYPSRKYIQFDPQQFSKPTCHASLAVLISRLPYLRVEPRGRPGGHALKN